VAGATNTEPATIRPHSKLWIEFITSSQINDDFGPYSENVTQEAEEKLTLLGDWDGSVQNLDEAISNFYSRTQLPAAQDTLQQLIDINMVVSAEREANRALGEDSSEEMQSYAYAIAPWLEPPAASDDNQLTKSDDTPSAVAAVINEPSIEDLLTERSALNTAITSLDSTLESLANTVESLY